MDVGSLTQEQAEQEIQRVHEALLGSDTISTKAVLMGGGVGLGAFAIYNNINADIKYIDGVVGGLSLSAVTDWGTLKIKQSINHQGYTGSCAVVMVHILGGYTHVTGYDQNSNPVFWLNAGGTGMGFFSGGGRFTVENPVS